MRNHLAAYRARHGTRGISKAQLARKVQVSRSYITKLERGACEPSLQVAFRLAAYFRCPVEALFEADLAGSELGEAAACPKIAQ
jgi:putative transcriptional regulator